MVAWLRDESGVRVPLGPEGTLIGRSAGCHVVVDDQAVSRKHVLVLHRDGVTEVLPLGRGRTELRGERLTAPVHAFDGDELSVGGARFVFDIRGGGASRVAATSSARGPLPSQIRFEPILDGARLSVTLAQEHVVVLLQRRADLMRALLFPEAGRAGDWIEDDALCARVWGAEGGSRARLNTLLHRVRASLTEVGLDGARMLERAPGGGATRVLLAPEAQVAIVDQKRPTTDAEPGPTSSHAAAPGSSLGVRTKPKMPVEVATKPVRPSPKNKSKSRTSRARAPSKS